MRFSVVDVWIIYNTKKCIFIYHPDLLLINCCKSIVKSWKKCNGFQTFDFERHLMKVIPIFWSWAYLMKVIPNFWSWAYLMKIILSVPDEGYSERTWWRLFWAYLMKVILSVPDEGYFERTWWRLFQKLVMCTRFD